MIFIMFAHYLRQYLLVGLAAILHNKKVMIMYNVSAAPSVTRAIANNHSTTTAHDNVFTRFYNWTVRQEERRFMWLAFTFILQIGLALPCALLSVVYLGGNNFNLWLLACIVNVPSLALNLAAQPTKVTLPLLFLAWLVDAGIIVYCFASFFIHQ